MRKPTAKQDWRRLKPTPCNHREAQRKLTPHFQRVKLARPHTHSKPRKLVPCRKLAPSHKPAILNRVAKGPDNTKGFHRWKIRFVRRHLPTVVPQSVPVEAPVPPVPLSTVGAVTGEESLTQPKCSETVTEPEISINEELLSTDTTVLEQMCTEPNISEQPKALVETITAPEEPGSDEPTPPEVLEDADVLKETGETAAKGSIIEVPAVAENVLPVCLLLKDCSLDKEDTVGSAVGVKWKKQAVGVLVLALASFLFSLFSFAVPTAVLPLHLPLNPDVLGVVRNDGPIDITNMEYAWLAKNAIDLQGSLLAELLPAALADDGDDRVPASSKVTGLESFLSLKYEPNLMGALYKASSERRVVHTEPKRRRGVPRRSKPKRS